LKAKSKILNPTFNKKMEKKRREKAIKDQELALIESIKEEKREMRRRREQKKKVKEENEKKSMVVQKVSRFVIDWCVLI